MENKKYGSKIEVFEDKLVVTLRYSGFCTDNDVKIINGFSRTPVQINQNAVHDFACGLCFELGKERKGNLLPEIHKIADYVLPLLIRDLDSYSRENFGEPTVQLVERAKNIIMGDENENRI